MRAFTDVLIPAAFLVCVTFWISSFGIRFVSGLSWTEKSSDNSIDAGVAVSVAEYSCFSYHDIIRPVCIYDAERIIGILHRRVEKRERRQRDSERAKDPGETINATKPPDALSGSILSGGRYFYRCRVG